MKKIVITSALRTAVGSLNKTLKNVSASDVGSNVISSLLKELFISSYIIIPSFQNL